MQTRGVFHLIGRALVVSWSVMQIMCVTGLIFCLASSSVAVAENVAGDNTDLDLSTLFSNWDWGATAGEPEELAPEPNVHLALVRSDDPSQPVGAAATQPAGVAKGWLIDWIRGVSIDGRPVFTNKFAATESSADLLLAEGEHTIEPGGYKFTLKDGQISSNSPFLLAAGKELRLVLYPVTFQARLRSYKDCPATEASVLPGITLLVDQQEVYRPPDTFVSSLIGMWSQYVGQTVYLPAGVSYTVYPGGFTFSLSPEGVGPVRPAPGTTVTEQELRQHVVSVGSTIAIDSYRVVLAAFVPQQERLLKDAKLQYMVGSTAKSPAWTASSAGNPSPAVQALSRSIFPERTVSGGLIVDSIDLLWNADGYRWSIDQLDMALHVPADFTAWPNKALLAAAGPDRIGLLQINIAQTEAREDEDVNVMVRYANPAASKKEDNIGEKMLVARLGNPGATLPPSEPMSLRLAPGKLFALAAAGHLGSAMATTLAAQIAKGGLITVIEDAKISEVSRLVRALESKIAALPEESAEEKIKKATLRWAWEDANLSLDAARLNDAQGPAMVSAAQSLLNDIQSALDRPIGRRVTPPADLLPMLQQATGNPYLSAVFNEVEGLRQSGTIYQKGEAGYKQIENSWSFSSLGSQVYLLIWAFVYPDSPYAGDPEVLVRALRILQAIYQNHRDGDFNPGRTAIYGSDPNINRFTFVPTFEAHLLLRTAYPDLILPSKEQEWQESARVATEFQIKTYGRKVDLHGAGHYANMDVHYLHLMELASRLLNNPTYHAEAQRFLGFIEQELYPDGAFSYIAQQNECSVYHGVNIVHLARYWQLTSEQRALDLVRKSAPYYPYNVEPGAIPEYYTDPFWKHYWEPYLSYPQAADIVATLANDLYNKRVANDSLKHKVPGGYYSIYGATFWTDMPDRPLPDAHIIDDRNVQGPRGRFGRWSFAGTTRDYGPGAQGKDTFVGGMVVSEQNELDAALQVVTSQYRLQPGYPYYKTCRYLSQAEKNAYTVADGFAALTTRYRIQNVAWGGKSTLTDWAGQQEWLLLPDRLVGLLVIETLSDQKGLAINGRIRLGMNKSFTQLDETTFGYGALLIRLHEHNYAGVTTQNSETFYLDEPTNYRSAEIVLHDSAGLANKDATPVLYPKGTRQYFIVEVLPRWSTPATRVQRIATPEGLAGIELQAGGQHLRLVHNPTDVEQTYRDQAMGANMQIYYSANGKVVPESLTVRNGQMVVQIAAHSHVVIALTK